MKISKATLARIIKEEVENSQVTQPEQVAQAAQQTQNGEKSKAQLDKEQIDALHTAIKDIAKKVPKNKGESDESWGSRIQAAAKKGLLTGIKATLLGPLSAVVSDEFALGLGRALATGGGFVLGGPEGAAIGNKAMDIVSTLNDTANSALGESKKTVVKENTIRKMIREAFERQKEESEAATKMSKLERGPKAVKALADFEDVVYDGPSSLIDILDADDDTDEK